MNFSNLLEQLEDDSKAIRAIRIGLNIRDNFWDDFMQVCNNAEGLANLLNVRTEQVIKWRYNIKLHLARVRELDNREKEKKTTIINTGKL